jgi:hypothetical protein
MNRYEDRHNGHAQAEGEARAGGEPAARADAPEGRGPGDLRQAGPRGPSGGDDRRWAERDGGFGPGPRRQGPPSNGVYGGHGGGYGGHGGDRRRGGYDGGAPRGYRGELQGHAGGYGGPPVEPGRGGGYGRGRGDAGAFGPYAGGPDQGARGRFAGVGPKGYQRSDERIREAVCDRLTDHPDLDASDMTVDVQQGEVTLEGTAPDKFTKRLAEQAVEGLPGVRDEHNRLRLRPAGDKPAAEPARADAAAPAARERGPSHPDLSS